MTMTCSDLDAPTTLTYQLSENGGGTFSIDSRGDITLIKSAHQTISHLVIYNLRFCQKDESNHNLNTSFHIELFLLGGTVSDCKL